MHATWMSPQQPSEMKYNTNTVEGHVAVSCGHNTMHALTWLTSASSAIFTRMMRRSSTALLARLPKASAWPANAAGVPATAAPSMRPLAWSLEEVSSSKGSTCRRMAPLGKCVRADREAKSAKNCGADATIYIKQSESWRACC